MADEQFRIKSPERVMRLGVALANPCRISILLALANGGAASATMLVMKGLGDLSVVAYHLRKLQALSVVTLVRTTQKRGAYEKHYVLSPFGREVVKTAATVGRKK